MTHCLSTYCIVATDAREQEQTSHNVFAHAFRFRRPLSRAVTHTTIRMGVLIVSLDKHGGNRSPQSG